MTEREIKLLSDIKLSISTIQDFTTGIESFQQYSSDLKTQSAVERQLAIVGEAINQLSKFSTIQLTYATQIIGLRNRLVHAYDNIDETIIWAILILQIPALKNEVSKHLEK